MTHIGESGRAVPAGEIIIAQGTEGDCAFLIEDGQVEIVIDRPGAPPERIGTRGPGTIIGEMALIDHGPRIATVRALKDCKLLEITRADFARRLDDADPVIRMVTQVVLTRYRDRLMRGASGSNPIGWPPAEGLERGYAAQTDVMESVKLANDFKAALERGELTLHYQPIIDLKRGAIAGFEALMRWRHAEQGAVSPGIFIPVAEKSGLITGATKWALREAMGALHRIETALAKRGGPAAAKLFMNVNFSSHDFAEPDFVAGILGAVADAGLQPGQLKVEITERLLIDRPDHARETLQACRDAGTGVAIDDFGTGYSSLNYLYYFPIETLKIDQSFIRIMNQEFRSRNLVSSIIRLGKSLDMTVVAEGVETPEEARLLRDMGCDMAQGFHFARPASEADVIAELTAAEPVWQVSA